MTAALYLLSLCIEPECLTFPFKRILRETFIGDAYPDRNTERLTFLFLSYFIKLIVLIEPPHTAFTSYSLLTAFY